MRELKGNWKDIFYLFEVSLDLKKISLALIGSVFSFVVLGLVFFYIGKWHFINASASFKNPEAIQKMWSSEAPVDIHKMKMAIRHGIEITFGLKSSYGYMEPKQVPANVNTNEPNWKRFIKPYEKKRTIAPIVIIIGLILFLNLIWAYFGGAISRMAAVNLIKDESVGLKDGLAFAAKRYKQFFYPAVLCFVLLAIFGLSNAFGGFIASISFAHLVTVIILLVALACSINVVVLKTMKDKPGGAKFIVGLGITFCYVVIGIVLLYLLSKVKPLCYAVAALLIIPYIIILKSILSTKEEGEEKKSKFLSCALLTIAFVIAAVLTIFAPSSDFVVLIFTPLALISGFIIAMILVGAGLGWPLFYPVIAVESTDFFDATSRSMSYVLARPAHYLFYQVIAFLFGLISTAIVVFIGYLMVKVTLWTAGLFFSVGYDYDRLSRMLDILFGTSAASPSIGDLFTGNIPWSESLATIILGFWLYLVIGLIASYVVSYFFSSQTLIYILMRKVYDGIDVDEIYEEPEEKAEQEEEKVEVLETEKTDTKVEEKQTQSPSPEPKPEVGKNDKTN